MPQVFYALGKIPYYLVAWKSGWSQRQSGHCWTREVLLPLLKTNPWISHLTTYAHYKDYTILVPIITENFKMY